MNRFIFSFLLLTTSFSVQAVTWEKDDFKLDANGYVGYKFIGATVENSALPSKPELGLALSAQYGNHLSLYTQFAYDENIDHAIVYSFAAFDWQFENDVKLTLKAGKLRNKIGLYNEYRINPRTRPGVVVPQAIYWDSLSYLLTSGVGIGFDIAWKNLEFGYQIAEPVSHDPIKEAQVWSRGLLEKVQVSFGSSQNAYVKYNIPELSLTLNSSWAQLNLGNKSSKLSNFLFPQIIDQNEIYNIFINSVEFMPFEGFTFTGESLFVKTPINFDNDMAKWSKGYSFTAKYELTEKINIYSNYNYYQSQQLPNTPKMAWQLMNTTDVNVGINYHEADWQIGAEIHKIQGGRWAVPDDYRANPNDYKDWYMIGVNFAYFF